MNTRWHSVLVLAAVLVTVLAACGSDSTTPAAYRDLDGPQLVASADTGDLGTTWEQLASLAVDLRRLGEGADSIPGFEPFNDPRIALSDGRFVVRGRWEGDEPIAGWYQRTPASLGEGEDNPVIDTKNRPIRLFVYEPGSHGLLPISQIPDVHAFSTAMYVGESADVVLAVVVLTGERVVAYTTGFNGAAYDIPRGVYVAPIPSR